MDYSKNRLGALAVANEKMEIIRNLDYADVGATGEAVSGNVPQDEDVTENGHAYHVHTLVAYVDDPFDGKLGGSPNDAIPEDYKLVEVTVSWNTGGSNAGSVSLSSRFVPDGLEIADPNTGILSINVLGSDGSAVTGAAVNIVNPDVNINETLQTDAGGNVMLVGAKAALQDYRITVSKSGYETVATLPPYPTTSYNPTYAYQSVVNASLNTVNIIEDKTANLTVSSTDQSGNPVKNVGFSLSGGRVLGKQAVQPCAPMYDLSVTAGQTDSTGIKPYTAISPGPYVFAPSGSVSGYALVSIEPVSPFSLAPGQNLNLNMKLASASVMAALISVNNSAHTALSGVSVELSNASGYDETITTDGNGTAYFPISAGNSAFVAGSYTLKVSSSNYQADTETVVVNSGALLNKSVSLISN